MELWELCFLIGGVLAAYLLADFAIGYYAKRNERLRAEIDRLTALVKPSQRAVKEIEEGLEKHRDARKERMTKLYSELAAKHEPKDAP